jgi:hypothetical protein
MDEVGELVPRYLGDWDLPGRSLYRRVPYVQVELPVLDFLALDEHVPHEMAVVLPPHFEFLVGRLCIGDCYEFLV